MRHPRTDIASLIAQRCMPAEEIPLPTPSMESSPVEMKFDVVEHYRSLLRSGVPKEHAIHLANKHIEGLRALTEDTPDRDLAIRQLSEFVQELLSEQTDASGHVDQADPG